MAGYRLAGRRRHNAGSAERRPDLRPDGTWKTAAGGSGTSWLAGDLVYIEGKTRDNYTCQFSLKHRQIADGSHELWGVIDARPGTEQVTLKQIR